MSTAILVGVYQPGTTLLHRAPVGLKIAGLSLLSLAIVMVRSMPASFGFLAVALVAALVARVRLGTLVRATRVVLFFALFAAALQWWWYGAPKAIETLVDLVTLTLLAITVSATTPVQAMLDTFVRWISPLRRFGVDPERVSLTIALAIGALPGTLAIGLETRDAARARGLGRHPRAFLTPFVIRVVARAHETGDALHARGLGDD